MASLRGRGGCGFLVLLLRLRLLGPLLSGSCRPQEESQVTLALPESPTPPRPLKLPEIPDPAAAPAPPAPSGAPGSGPTSESAVGRVLQSHSNSAPVKGLHSVCGHRTMRIFGGTEAPKRKWPWQVSLQTYDRHICGGSLISNQLVLTAAHCIRVDREYTVMLGDNRLYHLDENTVVIPVIDVVFHQYFDSEHLTNDIALAQLAFPVNYSSYIQPICLPERPFEENPETVCWVTGWGRVESAVQTYFLREAEQKILSHKTCNRKYQQYFRTKDNPVQQGMICGYYHVRRSPCWGDSGGPLACEVNNTWIQLGIVSWGYRCGYNLLPAVYTDVIQYKKWVHDILNQSSHIYSRGFCVLLICLMLPLFIVVTL